MAQIRVRRGTTAEWTDANPVLASGEPGYDTVTETFKVGNGVDTWDDLDGISGNVASVNGDTGTVVLDAGDVGARADDWVPSWSDVTGKPSTFTPEAHTHDDRYYTEGEMISLLADKANDVVVVKLTGNQTIGGAKTFSTSPILPDTAPANNQAVRKSYVDDGLAGKANSNHNHDDRYYTEAQTDNLLDDKVDVASLVSEDPDNSISVGSDGGVWAAASQPPGDYPENSDIAAQFKYAAPVWVLEFDEDETDIPVDFPTAPFFSGGPPPIVLRKKDV